MSAQRSEETGQPGERGGESHETQEMSNDQALKGTSTNMETETAGQICGAVQGSIADSQTQRKTEGIREERRSATTPSSSQAPQSTPTQSTDAPASSAAGTSKIYTFRSKYGTDNATFHKYIQALDDNKGSVVADSLPWQSYMTNLTLEQVADVKKQDWFGFIAEVEETNFNDDDESRATNFTQPEKTGFSDIATNHLDKRASGQRNPTLASQLKMLSADPNSDKDFSQNYAYDDDSLGRNEWIYIVDTGFNMASTDLAANGRSVLTYVVPNEYTLQWLLAHPNSLQTPDPESMDDVGGKDFGDGHGTGVASAAAGVTYGVASNANLYLIKAKGSATFDQGDLNQRRQKSGYTLEALENAFDHIARHYKAAGLGRAVVNVSFGLKNSVVSPVRPVDEHSAAWGVWSSFMAWCDANDVVLVAAAGNAGPDTIDAGVLGDHVPQRMGTDDNNLITVGGLTPDASFWTQTTPEGPAEPPLPNEDSSNWPGKITVYAQATGVQVIGNGLIQKDEEGTSFAAPQVAGLAAYFYAQGGPPGRSYPSGDGPKYIKDGIKKLWTTPEGTSVIWADGRNAANNQARGRFAANSASTPNAVCRGTHPFTLDQGNYAITTFCSAPPWTSNRDGWAPPSRKGKRDYINTGANTSIGTYPDPVTDHGLVLEMGVYPAISNPTFSENNCKKFFSAILNNCDTTTGTDKHGGYLTDSNTSTFYEMTAFGNSTDGQ